MRRLMPAVIPALLVVAIALPYQMVPVAAAIPMAFGGVILVAWWSSWRQRPRPTSMADDPRLVRPPVRGQWAALNTPKHRVPSHGTHLLAQSYALDLVVVDGATPSSDPGRWSLWRLRQPDSYHAYGQPVVASGHGTIVQTYERSRDHRGRDSLFGLAVWFLAQFHRSFMGARGLLGNHIILSLDDGVFALFAHLQKGSLEVHAGDHVESGQVIAACGNSGNSTEPHIHFQLMDAPDPWRARGIPVTFDDIELRSPTGDWTAAMAQLPDRHQHFRTHQE